MEQTVSNLIPKSEGNNITAEDMLGIADIVNFINFMESVPESVLAQVMEVKN